MEPPEDQVELEKRLKLRVTLLSDANGAVLDAFGVRDERGPPVFDRWFKGARPGDISMPTTVLVDRAGRIRLLYRSSSVDDRPPVSALLAAQKRMQLAETTDAAETSDAM